MVVSRSVGHSWIKAREARQRRRFSWRARHGQGHRPASAARPQIPQQGSATPSAHHVNHIDFGLEQEIVAKRILKGGEDRVWVVWYYPTLAAGAERK